MCPFPITPWATAIWFHGEHATSIVFHTTGRSVAAAHCGCSFCHYSQILSLPNFFLHFFFCIFFNEQLWLELTFVTNELYSCFMWLLNSKRHPVFHQLNAFSLMYGRKCSGRSNLQLWLGVKRVNSEQRGCRQWDEIRNSNAGLHSCFIFMLGFLRRNSGPHHK